MSGLDREGLKDPHQHEKIESLVRGLQEIFGPRAEDIARRQHATATVGSETAEVWRLILDELKASTNSFPRGPGAPAAIKPQEP